jgi:isopentenyldiphosphate isomerase
VAGDTVLIAVAGGLSLALQNDLFFKLKPAIIEIVLAAAMGALLVLPDAFLKGYVGRMVRGVSIPDTALPAMKKSLGVILAVIAAHVALTLYAAFALSTAAWGFISGGLLYILFGVFAAGSFAAAKLKVRNARSSGNEEMLPVIDEEGKILGVAARSECHKGPGKLHPVVHLQIIDGLGAMYLQRRAQDKAIEPGKWDSAVGGHVAAGEDLDTALAREISEELGITRLALESAGARIQPILRYKWESEAESEMVFSFIVTHRGPFRHDDREAPEGRFWSFAEIRASLRKGVFTPNFEHEYGLIEGAAAESTRARQASCD